MPLQSNIYFSVDIETNGLAAGLNSMISLGVAAIDMHNGNIVGTFKRNLEPIPELQQDASTMKFWEGFPEAYKAATSNPITPYQAMCELVDWVKGFNVEHPVAAAWKPGFDLAFLRYYLFRYIGNDIFGRAGSGLDIKTLTAIALGQAFSDTQIAKVPKELKGTDAEHNHDALDDAIEQAHVMYNARKLLKSNI